MSTNFPIPQTRLVHLDMLRALAAIAVCAGHIRGFLFVDYSHLPTGYLLTAPFYALTSLGHQAVVIFFALSGYLVGGQAIRQIKAGKWHFGRYATRRISRLWTVLIPALLLTLIADRIGLSLSGAAGYAGDWYAQFSSGPSVLNQTDHSIKTLLGNIAFIQTISVPVFGSNGPLWSLANEFWYYLIFPLFLFSVIGKGRVVLKTAAFIAAIAAAFYMPFIILILGIVWVAGAVTALAQTHIQSWKSPKLALATLVTTLVFLALLLTSLKLSATWLDIALGISCAMILPILAALPSPGKLYQKLSFAGSEISYTLYVVHFPLLALITFTVLQGRQFLPSLTGFGIFTALLITTLVFASIMWWIFERNTFIVRKSLDRIFNLNPSKPN